MYLKLEIKNLCNCVEAITLLHNAAAKCGYNFGDNSLYEGIKEQQAKVETYCASEKVRLAEIIRNTGKLVFKAGWLEELGTGMSDRRYDCDGEIYRITTDADGNIEEIICVEEDVEEL